MLADDKPIAGWFCVNSETTMISIEPVIKNEAEDGNIFVLCMWFFIHKIP